MFMDLFFNRLKLEQTAIGKLLKYNPNEGWSNHDDMFLDLVWFNAKKDSLV